jgi:hypothetical protein
MEAVCGSLPCNWTGSSGTQSVTSPFHAGARSLAVFAPNTSTGGGAFHCVSAGAGSYAASTWYQAAVGGFMQFSLFYFGAPGCGTSFLGSSIGFETVAADGVWHFYGTTGVAPAGTASILVQINYGCSSCPSGANLYVDDVLLHGGAAVPTAVTRPSLGAVRGPAGGGVGWRARAETRVARFAAWRGSRAR